MLICLSAYFSGTETAMMARPQSCVLAQIIAGQNQGHKTRWLRKQRLMRVRSWSETPVGARKLGIYDELSLSWLEDFGISQRCREVAF